MSKKVAIAIILIGIVIMAVPFFIRMRDIQQAEEYIKAMGVNKVGDDAEDAEDEGKTGSGKKKDSEDIYDGAIGIIEIPSLDIRYPVFEGAGDTQLNKGIGHLTDTAGLLEKGNCVLAGHNGSRRGAFFTRLPEIETGACVILTDKDMESHTYVVTDMKVVDPYDNSVCEDMEEECLTLFTCTCNGTRRFVCRCRPVQ